MINIWFERVDRRRFTNTTLGLTVVFTDDGNYNLYGTHDKLDSITIKLIDEAIKDQRQ